MAGYLLNQLTGDVSAHRDDDPGCAEAVKVANRGLEQSGYTLFVYIAALGRQPVDVLPGLPANECDAGGGYQFIEIAGCR